jgi:hypothetical protein
MIRDQLKKSSHDQPKSRHHRHDGHGEGDCLPHRYRSFVQGSGTDGASHWEDQKARGQASWGVRTFRRFAKKALLYAKKLGKDKRERVERANHELSQMAKKIIQKVPHISKSSRHQIHRLSRPKKSEAKRLGLELSRLKELTQRIIDQNAQRFLGHYVPNKVYSLDEPHVAAIKKGKQAKPTEYGAKVSLTVDQKGFVISHVEYPTNLADIHTLPDVSRGWKKTPLAVSQENLRETAGFITPKSLKRTLEPRRYKGSVFLTRARKNILTQTPIGSKGFRGLGLRLSPL